MNVKDARQGYTSTIPQMEGRYDKLCRLLDLEDLGNYERMKTLRTLMVMAAEADLFDIADFWAALFVEEGWKALPLQESPTRKSDVYEWLGDAYRQLAYNDLHSYMMALEWHREPSKRFYQPRRKILRRFADEVTRLVTSDELDILGISMPPGTGKSTASLFAMSWIIGRNPMKPNLATGHSETLTKTFYDEMVSLTTDPEYDYGRIFPHIRLTTQSSLHKQLDFRDDGKDITRRYPSLTCRSIDGTLTGATRAEGILYCDDLVADIVEAMNPSRLEALYNKYISNARSRKKSGCKELHVATRWSINDPIGRLKATYEGNPRVKFIRIPALDPVTGESNFEYDNNVGFDTAYYNDMKEMYKRANDLVSWECLYQQNPMEREGLLFPEDGLRRFMSLPPGKPDKIVAFCDVAFGGIDYLSLPVAHIYGDDIYIADAVFTQGDYEKTIPIVMATLMRNGVQEVIFEANNGGDFYAREVRTRLKKEFPQYMCSIKWERAGNTAKQTRIQHRSPDISTFLYLDESEYPPDGMYRQFVANLTGYTILGKNRNDDAPDSLAGLAAMLGLGTKRMVKTTDARRLGL